MPVMIRSASLTNFADIARKVGLDPVRMVSEFGLPGRSLRSPDMRVSADAVRQLLEAAAERSGAEGFGLLMAETRQLSALGPAGLLIREAPTLRDALAVLARYSRQINEALFLTIEETGDVVVLREKIIVGRAGPVRQSTELALGVVFRILQGFLGSEWRPRRVCFAHDAPADGSVHARLFGRRVEFGADFNGIVCARADLDLRNANIDPAMARFARKLLDEGEIQEGPAMSARVRELVATLLESGRCTVEQVARHLNVNRRTIHRQLAREDKSYADILDAVRREQVGRYLRNRNLTLAQVSALLGFSAPSGFSRWYRRQFGATASTRRAVARRRTH
jgi:AraC-like DNA-binding protein